MGLGITKCTPMSKFKSVCIRNRVYMCSYFLRGALAVIYRKNCINTPNSLYCLNGQYLPITRKMFYILYNDMMYAAFPYEAPLL